MLIIVVSISVTNRRMLSVVMVSILIGCFHQCRVRLEYGSVCQGRRSGDRDCRLPCRRPGWKPQWLLVAPAPCHDSDGVPMDASVAPAVAEIHRAGRRNGWRGSGLCPVRLPHGLCWPGRLLPAVDMVLLPQGDEEASSSWPCLYWRASWWSGIFLINLVQRPPWANACSKVGRPSRVAGAKARRPLGWRSLDEGLGSDAAISPYGHWSCRICWPIRPPATWAILTILR